MEILEFASGKKSPFLMGKSTISMLKYAEVC
jgi:hypothetical protein